MSALFRHRRRLHQVVPDLGYVTKYTDQGPYPGNHWFWRDGRRNHGHNDKGQAYLRWKVRPTAASGYGAYGEFTVVRLLLEHADPTLPRNAAFTSTCGLSQCINPAHWQRVIPPPVWRLQILDAGRWQLVRVTTGKSAVREVAVHVAQRDVVHLLTALPLERRTTALLRVACGVELVPEELVVTTADLTCEGCT